MLLYDVMTLLYQMRNFIRLFFKDKKRVTNFAIRRNYGFSLKICFVRQIIRTVI